MQSFLQIPIQLQKAVHWSIQFDTIIHAVHSGTSHNLSQCEFMPVLTKLLHLSTKKMQLRSRSKHTSWPMH